MQLEKPKTTALFEEQKKASAKFMLFHGWKLAREFSSAQKEHKHVRKSAGLFDISHMGEIRVQGLGALPLLQKTLTNQVDKLTKNQAQYNLMCNEKGGVIDDLILYCLEPKQDYLLCVNSPCVQKDFKWLKKHNTFKAILKDESDRWAGLSVQGPKALEVMIKTFCSQTKSGPNQNLAQVLTTMKKNQCQWFAFENQACLVSATGYTGEKGFEIFLSPQVAPLLWQKLLKLGQGILSPAGLLSRDTLRLESQYPLYGQELSEDKDPLSAGLSWALKNKTHFIGSQALSHIQVTKKRVAFILKNPARVPRLGNLILNQGQTIGEVTSGAFSPTLSSMIGMGYVLVAKSAPLTKIQIDIHGDLYPALIVPRLLNNKP